MAETINLPKIGPVKKSYVYAGGAVVGGYVAWRWWQSGMAAAGTAEEEMVPEPESVGTIGADIGSGAGGYYPTPPIGGNVSEEGVIINNMQWSAKAQEWLVYSGYSEKAAGDVIGKYLAGNALTAGEQVMIQLALAFAGQPPIPPKEPEGTTPPEPSVIGTPKNLRSGGSATETTVPLQWDGVGGAAGYSVYRDGSLVGSVSGKTTFTASGLTAGKSYDFTVRAKNSAGTLGSASNTYVGRTKSKAQTPDPKPPKSKIPPYRTAIITRKGQTLSDLVAANNRKHGGRNPSWQEVWSFNLKYRPASTVKTLKARGPHRVYRGTRFWIPK